MRAADLLKKISGRVPARIQQRAAFQIMRARWATAARLRQAHIVPGMPIVGESLFDGGSDWRARFAAALWTIAREALQADDRRSWMLCVGYPPESIEDLYALGVQAEPLVQLHFLSDAGDAAEFRSRYVPAAALREASGRGQPSVTEVLAQSGAGPRAFERATAARASAHTFVKRLGGGRRVIAADAETGSKIGALATAIGVKLLIVGEVGGEPPEATSYQEAAVARLMGFSLLDELAMVRVCDGYIGAPDEYALLAADGGVRCLLRQNVMDVAGRPERVHIVGDVSTRVAAWLRNTELEVAGVSFIASTEARSAAC